MATTVFEAFIPLSQHLRSRPDGDWLVAFALKYFFTHHRIERVQQLQKAEHKREEHERKLRGSEAAEPAAPKRRRSRRRLDPEVTQPPPPQPVREGRSRSRRRGEHQDLPRADAPAAGAAPGTPPHASGPTGDAPLGVAAPAAQLGATVEAPPPARPPPKGRVFIKLGEGDGADEPKLRGLMSTHAPEIDVLAIEVRQTHSFVEVSPDAVETLVAALDGKELEGKRLFAERARRRRR